MTTLTLEMAQVLMGPVVALPAEPVTVLVLGVPALVLGSLGVPGSVRVLAVPELLAWGPVVVVLAV